MACQGAGEGVGNVNGGIKNSEGHSLPGLREEFCPTGEQIGLACREHPVVMSAVECGRQGLSQNP